METTLTLITSILERATFKRVLMVGLLIFFCLLGYLGYLYAPPLVESTVRSPSRLVSLNAESTAAVKIFMKKYSSAAYLTVLRFEIAKNTRVPIHRSFNSAPIEKLVIERLNGGDGALPVFIRGDHSNNEQMISVLQGEYRCDPFDGGGLARVWPDLVPRFTTSCRSPLPPLLEYGARGYIVVHFNKALTTYELDAIRIDLLGLAQIINKQ